MIPVLTLIGSMVCLIIWGGAETVQMHGKWLLTGSAAIAIILAFCLGNGSMPMLKKGIVKSAKQILPSIPILVLIGTVSATWMLSGVVPLMIKYGLMILNPTLFLFTACAISALISQLTGSSWTTIATIGVALMGIGSAMGYSSGWLAGAIISGAYFGDKLSPLSDTTVLASSSCEVGLFNHIRAMLVTTIPSMLVALTVFIFVGLIGDYSLNREGLSLITRLSDVFTLTPWLLIVPVVTITLILCRVNSYVTLSVSTLSGLLMTFVFQPQIVEEIAAGHNLFSAAISMIATSTQISTGSSSLDELVATGGIEGMMDTIMLVLCAMTFGGAMIGTGMLDSITSSLSRRINSRQSAVGATVGTGLALNGCTGDQFLSIIIVANMYKSLFDKKSLDRKLLSRTVEDSVSVTSVLIPWNSCALTQSAVLGISTLSYLPYCIFNLMSPVMSLLVVVCASRIQRFHRKIFSFARIVR